MYRSLVFKISILFVLGIGFLKAQPGQLPAPYCMPGYFMCPCNQAGPSNAPGNSINDFIHSFKTLGAVVNINNVGSGCNAQNFPSIGIRNYIYNKCQHNLVVNAGQVITFSIQSSNIFSQGVAVFVDWDLDAVFATTETIVVSPGVIPAGTWGTYTATIPPTQPNGVYRMRARSVSFTNGPAINPCNNYSYGETEDYDIYVGTSPPPQVVANISNNGPLCAGNTLSLNLSYTTACSPTYTWFGPNAFTSTAQNPTITNAQAPVSGNYTLTIMCTTVCPVTLITTVVVTPTNMIANAGPSQTLCVPNVMTSFSASPPAVGNGTWSIITGTGSVFPVNLPNANGWFAAPTQSYNVFAWTIGAPGCQSTSTMAVTIHTDVANAGTSQTICAQSSIVLNGNMPSAVTGSWTLISGSGNISSPTSATTNVTSLGAGTNVFQWSLTHTFCGTSVSQVTITNYGIPTLSAVSNPTSICSGEQASLTASGALQYNWQPSGTGSMIVVSPAVASTYTIIGNNGPCFGTPITVSVGVDPLPTQAVAGSSITICTNTTILAGNSPSIGTGSWSLISGSATITNPNSPNTALVLIGSGTHILQWTTTLGNCISTSTTLVQNSAVMISTSGNPPVICAGESATLTASGAVNYTWEPSGGNSSVAIVSPTATTAYTVTGSNGTCSANSIITQSVVVCTGVKMVLFNNDQLKIYPNPFKDELKIVSAETIEIKLLDVNGKEILRKEINSEISINTSQFARGVYFIHIIGNPSVKPIKVIKH